MEGIGAAGKRRGYLKSNCALLEKETYGRDDGAAKGGKVGSEIVGGKRVRSEIVRSETVPGERQVAEPQRALGKSQLEQDPETGSRGDETSSRQG